MQVNLNHYDWRVLREVKRAKKKPVVGSKLRLEMSRRTKDGEFLTDLVRLELLQVAQKGKTPFESTFLLTDLGEHAAEYGVYDIPLEKFKELNAAK